MCSVHGSRHDEHHLVSLIILSILTHKGCINRVQSVVFEDYKLGSQSPDYQTSENSRSREVCLSDQPFLHSYLDWSRLMAPTTTLDTISKIRMVLTVWVMVMRTARGAVFSVQMSFERLRIVTIYLKGGEIVTKKCVLK